jgi:hypothetical protein
VDVDPRSWATSLGIYYKASYVGGNEELSVATLRLSVFLRAPEISAVA